MNECISWRRCFQNEIRSDEGHSMTLCQIRSTDLLLRKFQLRVGGLKCWGWLFKTLSTKEYLFVYSNSTYTQKSSTVTVRKKMYSRKTFKNIWSVKTAETCENFPFPLKILILFENMDDVSCSWVSIPYALYRLDQLLFKYRACRPFF